MSRNLKFLSILLFVSLIFYSCYSKHTIQIDKKTDSIVRKPFTVKTKDGKTYDLIYYMITHDSLIGKDLYRKDVKIPKDNIKEIISKKPNKIIIISFFTLYIGSLLFLYYVGQHLPYPI